MSCQIEQAESPNYFSPTATPWELNVGGIPYAL
jgi:hypothetical protein